jgi:hypothetical protein
MECRFQSKLNLGAVIALAGVIVLGLGCGGNYSNEDVEFQLAIPDRDDLAARLPSQALVIEASSEYYRATRNVVLIFNGVVDDFLRPIDQVRRYPANERSLGHRGWGPFIVREQPAWELKITIDRFSVTQFEYAIGIRPARSKADVPWIFLIKGLFDASGGVRQGTGTMLFTGRAAREAGYDLGGLAETDELRIDHDTMATPITVKMHIIDRMQETTDYEYREALDGAGELIFTFPTPDMAPYIQLLDMRSRWKGTGEGRSDVRVIRGTLLDQKGIDCWGIDTLPLYMRRDFDTAKNQGTEASCAFGPP